MPVSVPAAATVRMPASGPPAVAAAAAAVRLPISIAAVAPRGHKQRAAMRASRAAVAAAEGCVPAAAVAASGAVAAVVADVAAAAVGAARMSRSSTTSRCSAISTTVSAYYRFSYLGSDRAYVGVMAQEVQTVRPDAVERGRDGYLRVHYDKLGVKFQSYERWIAAGARVPASIRAVQ